MKSCQIFSFAALLIASATFLPPNAVAQKADATKQTETPLVEELDRQRSELSAVFSHDFVADGLPIEYFTALDGSLENLQQRRDGLVMRVHGGESWTSTNLTALFQLEGDFDIEATFNKLKLEGKDRISVGVAVSLNGEQRFKPRILRSSEEDQRQTVRVSMTKILNGDRRLGKDSLEPCEANSGVLRLCRRSETMYYLVAESQDHDFRLIGERIATSETTIPKAIQLRALTKGSSHAEVVWTNLRVAAEKLLLSPRKGAPRKKSLYVLTFADGKLEKIASPEPGMTQLGSAEWSSDGKTIVCDMSKGSTTTSRVVRMNADGSDMQDLGPGCMPSQSPDGKQIVYSVTGSGIMRMQSDGSGAETLDSSGWGTQWSPDGKYIAWGNRNNVTILNTETDEKTQLLTEAQQKDVTHVYWNLGWSHDSKSIAFKSRSRQNEYQVVVADVESKDGFKILHTADDIEEDMSWLPDNKTVLFTTILKEGGRRRFASVSREEGATVKPFPGIPDELAVLNIDCSPDGKRAVFTGTPPPAPVVWNGQ